MKTITVNGIHCDACKQLIMMELEEAKLVDHIAVIEIDENNIGTISLKDSADDEVISNIKQTINAMDNYSTK